jgi:hypothetical protein
MKALGKSKMALIRWEPFREIETIQQQMNQLFAQILLPQQSD